MSLPEPITRKEQYYDGIAKGNASKLPEPITREEQYLEYIAKNGGGGGGGTTDYEALDNKPSVNGVELSGNKTLDDLGIQGKLTFDNEPTEDSQNPVKSGGVYDALESLDEAISRKPDEYADLTDKPSINSVELDGNKTASDLGLQTELKGAQTVEGNPITITDAEAMNAEDVKVELEPKQDLHGYDAPWVGGAGKNKLPLVLADIKAINTSGTWTGNTYTKDEMSYTILVDDGDNVVGIRVNGETSVNTSLNLPLFSLPTGTYIVSVGALRSRLNKNGSQIADISANQSYTLAVDSNSDEYILYLYPGATTISNVTVYPMIRLATESDADFEPYSNICPISGYSEVNLERVGKNLFDKTTATTQAYIRSSGEVYPNGNWRLSDYVRVEDEQFYTMSVVRMQTSRFYAVCFYDENKEYVGGYEQETEATHVTCQATFDKPSVYARFCVHVENLNNFMFEYGNQATTYEPYQGSTATIDLDGTKCGGTLDVTEGGYSDEWGYISGSSISDLTQLGATTTSIGSGLFAIYFPSFSTPHDSSTLTPIDDLRCNELPNVIPSVQWEANASGISINNQGHVIFTVKDITTQTDMDSWLSNNPIQIAYRKKTPSSVSTTPTDIPLLENTNNVSTNGTNIQLKYQPNNVIGEAKVYTDEQCAKVLPPLPTTDGTYHLSCEVTSGVGVLSWVSDS